MAKPLGVRIAGWLIGIPLAILVVLFALSNRHSITLAMWPLPEDMVISLPVYVVVLLVAVLGFFGGIAVAWFGGVRTWRRARSAERSLRRTESALQQAERKIQRQERSGSTGRSLVAAESD
ncbi:MAG: hypothetical protein QNJ92_07675 [Alphaproteobacteria bacterium]|nr:hypothetical protein [Alphaproteobacteria bacterium]